MTKIHLHYPVHSQAKWEPLTLFFVLLMSYHCIWQDEQNRHRGHLPIPNVPLPGWGVIAACLFSLLSPPFIELKFGKGWGPLLKIMRLRGINSWEQSWEDTHWNFHRNSSSYTIAHSWLHIVRGRHNRSYVGQILGRGWYFRHFLKGCWCEELRRHSFPINTKEA